MYTYIPSFPIGLYVICEKGIVEEFVKRYVSIKLGIPRNRVFSFHREKGLIFISQYWRNGVTGEMRNFVDFRYIPRILENEIFLEIPTFGHLTVSKPFIVRDQAD